MDDLMENEAFCSGIVVGIGLQQRRIIAAHEQREALIIGDELFYLQSGRERLEQVLSEICK